MNQGALQPRTPFHEEQQSLSQNKPYLSYIKSNTDSLYFFTWVHTHDEQSPPSCQVFRSTITSVLTAPLQANLNNPVSIGSLSQSVPQRSLWRQVVRLLRPGSPFLLPKPSFKAPKENQSIDPSQENHSLASSFLQSLQDRWSKGRWSP